MKNELKTEKIIELFTEGKNYREIARILDCNPETVRLRLKKKGIKTGREKCEIKCPNCLGNTQKSGKTKYGEQRYLCLNCGGVFFEHSAQKKEIRQRKKSERNELIRKMYVDDRLSTTEIGRKFGLSNVIVGKILKKNGVIRTISEAKLGVKTGSNLPIFEIIKHYTIDGLSCTEISDKLKWSKTSILKVLRENNIPRDNEYNYENKHTEKICELYLEGYSMNKIGKILNISYTTINSILHKKNIVRTEDRFGLGVDYNEWLKTLTVYRKYISDVMKITSSQNIKLLNNFEKRGNYLDKNAYHLDHKYSKLQGFKDNVPAEIIGNIENLEFIPWEENLKKKDKCSITLEELYKRVK